MSPFTHPIFWYQNVISKLFGQKIQMKLMGTKTVWESCEEKEEKKMHSLSWVMMTKVSSVFVELSL